MYQMCHTFKVWHIYATQPFDYKPFGDLQNAGEENRIGYFGEQRDKESDYFAMGFRLYDPEIGRFLAIDPLLDIQPSQTPYHYCFNNPTSFTDPTGLYPEKEKGDKVQMWVCDDYDLQNSFRMMLDNKAAYYDAILDFHRWSANMFSEYSYKKYLINKFFGGGGGGGSSSGREGTNQSGNGVFSYLPSFIKTLLDNYKDEINKGYEKAKKDDIEVGWPIIIGIDGNLRLGEMQVGISGKLEFIWKSSELAKGELFFGSFHIHNYKEYVREMDYFSTGDITQFGDMLRNEYDEKGNLKIEKAIKTTSFYHLLISVTRNEIYGLGCTNAGMYLRWQEEFYSEKSLAPLNDPKTVKDIFNLMFQRYNYGLSGYLIHFRNKYKP